jgi:hypothetical protein
MPALAITWSEVSSGMAFIMTSAAWIVIGIPNSLASEQALVARIRFV